MPGAVLAFLAHVEKSHLPIAAEPLPDRRDVDGICGVFGHGASFVTGCGRSASGDWPARRHPTRETAPIPRRAEYRRRGRPYPRGNAATPCPRDRKCPGGVLSALAL